MHPNWSETNPFTKYNYTCWIEMLFYCSNFEIMLCDTVIMFKQSSAIYFQAKYSFLFWDIQIKKLSDTYQMSQTHLQSYQIIYTNIQRLIKWNFPALAEISQRFSLTHRFCYCKRSKWTEVLVSCWSKKLTKNSKIK